MKGQNKISPTKIFICYAREDTEAAERIYKDLNSCGLIPFMDKFCLRPGNNWKCEIEEAIRSSRFVLILLSTRSLSKKGFVQKEIKAAIENAQEYPDSETYIIPMRLNDCEPQDKILRDLYYGDMFPNWDFGLQRILETIDYALNIKFDQQVDKSAYSQWIYIGNFNTETGRWIENHNGYLSTVYGIERLTPQGLVYKVIKLTRDTNVRKQPGINKNIFWIARKDTSVKILAVVEAFHFNPVVRRIWAAISKVS